MVHRGVAAETRDRGKHAEGVAGQEDDDIWIATLTHDLGVCDEVDGIGDAGVLGDRAIEVVGKARHVVDDHVLADAAKTDGTEYLGLRDGRDAYGLGVAAALEVEDAVLGPTMFVVSDEHALRVGRERRLARAGKTKEDGRLAGGRIHVGRRVHGKHVLLDGHEVVHDREDRLLDLARVAGAADEDLALLEVYEYGRLGVGAMARGIELEPRRREHGEVLGLEVSYLALRGPYEELAGEECLARTVAHDQELATPASVGPGDGMDDVYVA